MDIASILLDATYWGVEAQKINANFETLKNAVISTPAVIYVGVKSINGIYPNTSGVVTLTASSVGAISTSLLGSPNGLPVLGPAGIIAPQFLPEDIRGGLSFRGRADLDTAPVKGFYFATNAGQYVNFLGPTGIPIQLLDFEVLDNIVILYFNSNYWSKLLIPFPSTENASESLDLAVVARTGDYNDLLNIPDFARVAYSGNYSDLIGSPILAAVALSGSFADLQNVPDFVKANDLNKANNPPKLDGNLKLHDRFLTDAAKNVGAALMIGRVSPSFNPDFILKTTSAKLCIIAQTPGSYNKFGGVNVTLEEFTNNIVLIIGRDTLFTKVLIPFPEVATSVHSVNGLTGSVVLGAQDVSAIPISDKGALNGVAPLGDDGLIPGQYLPESSVGALETRVGNIESFINNPWKLISQL